MRVLTGPGSDTAFDLPPGFALVERRRAGLAVAAWQAASRGWVPGFDEYSLTIVDPGGRAWLERVGLAITDSFGLIADTGLDRRDALTTELCAACDLIALQPAPLHFEAAFVSAQAASVLLRGVALPLADGVRVQIVLSWREVLNCSATARLRRDFVAALRKSEPKSTVSDPFSHDFGLRPPT